MPEPPRPPRNRSWSSPARSPLTKSRAPEWRGPRGRSPVPCPERIGAARGFPRLCGFVRGWANLDESGRLPTRRARPGRAPRARPRAGQVRIEVTRCGICGSDLHARHGIDQWADLAARSATTASAAPTRRSCSGTSSAAGSPSTDRAAEGGAGQRHRVVALPIAAQRRRRRHHRPLRARAGGLRGAGARPGVDDDAGAQRPRPRRRGADRADGGGPARGSPRGGRQAGRGDRDRLRPGRPRGDPDAEGDRRAHGHRQRLLVRPAGARRALRSRPRRRPVGGLPL